MNYIKSKTISYMQTFSLSCTGVTIHVVSLVKYDVTHIEATSVIQKYCSATGTVDGSAETYT